MFLPSFRWCKVLILSRALINSILRYSQKISEDYFVILSYLLFRSGLAPSRLWMSFFPAFHLLLSHTQTQIRFYIISGIFKPDPLWSSETPHGSDDDGRMRWTRREVCWRPEPHKRASFWYLSLHAVLLYCKCAREKQSILIIIILLTSGPYIHYRLLSKEL